VTLAGKLRTDILADAMGMAEGYIAKAKDVILKAVGALFKLHVHMFPKDKAPQSWGVGRGFLCGAFSPGKV
jgi:hypothetical protein